MPKKRRNPNQFTTEEIQSATLAYTEGDPTCSRHDSVDKIDRKLYKYNYPIIRVRMCKKQGLEPISRAFGVTIGKEKTKRIICEPKDFPPDGKGMWRTIIPTAQALKILPLLPQPYQQKFREAWQRKGCPPKPYKPHYPKYIRYKRR